MSYSIIFIAIFIVLMIVAVGDAYSRAKKGENWWKRVRRFISNAVWSAIISFIVTSVLTPVISPVISSGLSGITEKWGPWSEWSSTPVTASSTRQVETKESTGYEMTVYVTQEDAAPYFRNFRDYSISGDYERYGARSSYGEKHINCQVSLEQLASAASYGPGEFIFNDDLYVGGYNLSSSTAYVMPIALDSQGRYYPLFIERELSGTLYRYRDRIS